MLKVAFATKGGTAVDDHFGRCRRFDVYEISASEARLLEVRELDDAPEDEQSKIASRLACVADVAMLHVCEIGGSAATRVVNARIHPVKIPPGTEIDWIITRLQDALSGTPPPWMRKVLRQHSIENTPAWTPTPTPTPTGAS